VKTGLAKHNQAYPNAANRIARIVLQQTPPQADAGEITEKGYLNQNKAQKLRVSDVQRLYNGQNDAGIIVL
jgi:feruloyl-CoA synthase